MGDYLYSDDHSLPSAYILKGHYTIQKVIGRGGFGITYAAFDSSLCISVAVKELFLRKICRRERDGCVSAPPEFREQYDEEYIDLLIRRLHEAGAKTVVLTGVGYSADTTGVVVADNEGKSYYQHKAY